MRKALFLLGILNDSDLDWIMKVGAKRQVAPGAGRAQSRLMRRQMA